MKEPLVTVVIPCYNYGSLVERAIESVCSQTYKSIEIIVINDGSTDESDEVLRSLIDKCDFLYISQSNKGIVPTRNRGVERAKGEYIIQLDADDYIPDNYVETLVKAANNSDADIYYTKAINPSNDEVIVFPREFDKELLKHQNYIHASSMYKKSLFDDNKYDEWLNGYAFEDWDFNLGSVLRGSKALLVPGTHLFYEQHDTGRTYQSRGDNAKEQEAIFYIIDKYHKQYPNEMLSPWWMAKNMKKLLDRSGLLPKEKAHYIKKIEILNKDIRKLKQYESLYDVISSSNSYKIGRQITLPIRALKYIKLRGSKYYVRSKNIWRIKKIIRNQYGIRIYEGIERPHVALAIRSIESPTSSTFIRMLSPLRHIVNKNRLKIQLVDGDKPKIARSIKNIIVQRTALIDMRAAEYVVETAKHNGARLFVDTDDAFSALDENHPQYHLQKERTDALNYIIENADEVWFSTSKLQSAYETKTSKIVRNTLDDKIWDKLREERIVIPGLEAPLEMVYMGTMTHNEDFRILIPALEKLHSKYPNQFRLHMIGVSSEDKDYPWLVELKPAKGGLYPFFTEWYNSIGPFDVGLSPLKDTVFNSNKSDIKCLDYLGIGIKPIVSDVEAYKNLELNDLIVRVLNNEEAWFRALEKELENRTKNRQQADKRIKAGYKYIKQHRLSNIPAQSIAESLQC